MRLNSVFGKFLLVCAFCMALPAFSHAQVVGVDTTKKIIQFSGIAVDADSLTPLPFVAIVIRHSERGVYSNVKGYYSMVVQPKDTVDFFALGYHNATFIITDTFTSNQYTHVQALRIDTILLHEAVVYPWPSKEQFKNAFLTADVPKDDLERARNNLSQAEMIRVAQNVAMDGGMVYAASMQQQTNRNYYAGQKPPNNLLNPVAWSRFIQSVQNGDLRRH
ncbi:MAG TPA: carboxypeptidase-like regulatory domain-containing protein [Bacteroidia bacterium]|nr:carboxypeptidase-like regulatory domain-containing protein [Bacteroidia bacterium]